VAAIARYLAAKTGVDLAARYPGDAALERLSGFGRPCSACKARPSSSVLSTVCLPRPSTRRPVTRRPTPARQANRGNAPVRGHVELTVTDEWGQVVFAAQTDAITLGVGETGTLAPSDIRTEWGPTVGGTYAVVARAVGGLVDGRTEMRAVYTFLGPAQPWPSDTTITQ
jgi:hypothetical protein